MYQESGMSRKGSPEGGTSSCFKLGGYFNATRLCPSDVSPPH